MTAYSYVANTGDNNFNQNLTLVDADTVVVSVGNLDRLTVQVSAGALAVAVSNDGTNYITAKGYLPGTPGTFDTSSVTATLATFLCDTVYMKFTAAGSTTAVLNGRRIGVFAQ